MANSVDNHVLRCTGCGAAVPLGMGATTQCAYCGAHTTVPASHTELQRAQAAFAQNRELADALYGELGRPPSWLTRWLGNVAIKAAPSARGVGIGLVAITRSLPLLGVAMLFTAMYVLAYPVAAIIRFGVGLYSPIMAELPLSPYLVLPVTLGALVALVAIPMVRWRRELRVRDVRIAAHAGLAATPPKSPGGPSCCRNCGAALDVPDGVLGAPCPILQSRQPGGPRSELGGGGTRRRTSRIHPHR